MNIIIIVIFHPVVTNKNNREGGREGEWEDVDDIGKKMRIQAGCVCVRERQMKENK